MRSCLLIVGILSLSLFSVLCFSSESGKFGITQLQVEIHYFDSELKPLVVISFKDSSDRFKSFSKCILPEEFAAANIVARPADNYYFSKILNTPLVEYAHFLRARWAV